LISEYSPFSKYDINPPENRLSLATEDEKFNEVEAEEDEVEDEVEEAKVAGGAGLRLKRFAVEVEMLVNADEEVVVIIGEAG